MAYVGRTMFPRGVTQLDASDPLNWGLFGWWPLDGASIGGTTAIDLSVRGNGTLVAGPTVAPGPFNGQSTALHMNGVSQAVQLYFPAIAAGTTMSLAFWVFPEDTSAGFQTLFSSADGTWALYYNSTSGAGTFGGLATSNSGFTGLTPNAWHHFAFTYIDNNLSGSLLTYVDGKLNLSSTGGYYTKASLLVSFGTNLAANGGTPFKGRYAQIGIWNYLLSPAQIYALANPPPSQRLWSPVRTKLWAPAGAAPVTVTMPWRDLDRLPARVEPMIGY